MEATQQQPKFDAKEARRFAALMAGFDTGNPSDLEAMGKGLMLRRMVAEKKIRLVDAWELPEIREALDAQLEPVRAEKREAIEPENEPWPARMTWFFVGVGGWCATASFLALKIVGAFALGCLVGFVEGVMTWRDG